MSRRVLCEAPKTRLTTYAKKADNNKFDWSKFWCYLRPHIWYFLAAIVGALVVAILNIQIPQVMGGVINVVAKYAERKVTDDFIKEMKAPAIKLVAMYVAQVIFCSTLFHNGCV